MGYSTKEFLEMVEVSEATLRRWIAEGDRIPELNSAKRDWRGWRVYNHDDVEELIAFHDMVVTCE